MDLPSTYVEGFHVPEAVERMIYTRLGSTDLKLSKLGVGGGTFGDMFGVIEENEGTSLVEEAMKHGVNYIDTSPYYGNTLSETRFGKALKGIPRQAYYISTKVGRYGTSWADFFDHSAERIVKEFEGSLKRLGLDYVDIVFIHDIEFSPLEQILTESLPAAQSLVDKKKARYIGVSGYPVSVLREAVEKSPVKIDVVLTYGRDCLFDATMKTYASFFQSKNVGLINASLTGVGLLTNDGPPSWHPASKDLKKLCHNASLYCKDQGLELAKIAVYYAMQQPEYSSHLVGMKSRKELKLNMEAATNELSDQEKKVLDDVKQKFFNSSENLHWEGVELNMLHEYREKNKQKK